MTSAERESRVTPYIRLMSFVGRVGARIFTRVDLVGAVDRIPRQGPLIIAGNHVSNADGVMLAGWLVPVLGRRIHWLAKREMLEWPVLGHFVRAYSVHPVERSGSDIEAFRVAERILRDGNALIVFPEGTRSPDGTLQRARQGLALLALRTGATILPVGITGTAEVWPRGGKPRRGGPVTITVGEPFRLAEVLDAGIDRKEMKATATDVIMRRIADLLPPGYRGAYAGSPSIRQGAPAEQTLEGPRPDPD